MGLISFLPTAEYSAQKLCVSLAGAAGGLLALEECPTSCQTSGAALEAVIIVQGSPGGIRGRIACYRGACFGCWGGTEQEVSNKNLATLNSQFLCLHVL